MTTPPTDDLRARLHSANTLFERMLRECARPVTGSPEGVPWLAAEAYREVAIAALSALPAGGERWEADGIKEALLLGRLKGHEVFYTLPAGGGGCGDHDHAKYIPGCPKCALTLPEKTTTPPADAEVLGPHPLNICPKCGDYCMDCECPADADVGAQGEASKIADEIMRLVQHGPTVDWRPNMAEIAEKVRRLATPAAGKGVDGLPAKWRATSGAIAKPYGFVTEHALGKAQALDACADELEAALTRQPVAGDGRITLTAAEISDLAEFVGLRATLLDEIEPDTEIDVYPCPAEGVRNEGEPSDPDSRSHYRYVAVMSEYPEEGCCGLGDEIAAPAATPTDGGEGK